MQLLGAGFGEFDESTAQSSGISEPRRTSDRVSIPGKKKRFVCYCEDVTDEDVETAIAEGYDSIELLKRYSTISMGSLSGCNVFNEHHPPLCPCQRLDGTGDRHHDCETTHHTGDARDFGGAKHGAGTDNPNSSMALRSRRKHDSCRTLAASKPLRRSDGRSIGCP